MKKLRDVLATVLNLLALFVGIFYAVFYSPQIANETWVMTLRYKYMLAVNKYDWLKPALRAARKDSDDG